MGSCEMYGIFKLSGTLATWKIRYCTADYGACARYQRSARGQSVPANLMPNGELLKRAAPEGAPRDIEGEPTRRIRPG